MDSYLDIARKVLKTVRRPLTAKGILNAAYRAKLVPSHLYGKTQEKTLQARLSEDILYHRESSVFYRTEPGVFFLTEFIADQTIPEKFREPFPARRRTRDLYHLPSLAIESSFVSRFGEHIECDWMSFVREAETYDAIRYCEVSEKPEGALIVWTFSIVRKGDFILSYRVGRYRDDHESFANKRTIGFPSVVSIDDRTLFSDQDYGASENSLATLLTDLDISAMALHSHSVSKPIPTRVIRAKRERIGDILLVVAEWDCPNWYEPTTRRLSINDPQWISSNFTPNNIEDFEPWSVLVLEAAKEFNGQ